MDDIQTPDDFGIPRILHNWRGFIRNTDLQPPRVLPPGITPSASMKTNNRAYYAAQAAYFNAMCDYGIEVPPVILVCLLAGRDILTLEPEV